MAGLVLATVSVWMFNSVTVSYPEWGMLAGVVLLLCFAVHRGLSVWKSAKRGETANDELSRKILDKASARSFNISMYLWLAIMAFSDSIHLPAHALIGSGILGMAVLFAGSWFYYNNKGVQE